MRKDNISRRPLTESSIEACRGAAFLRVLRVCCLPKYLASRRGGFQLAKKDATSSSLAAKGYKGVLRTGRNGATPYQLALSKPCLAQLFLVLSLHSQRLLVRHPLDTQTGKLT